jgi:cell division septation protein DedD
MPDNTAAASGTYDAATGRYTLTWTSTIVGGPFDKFAGQWHLEGTFRAAGAATAAPAAAPAVATPSASGSSTPAAAAAAPGVAPAAGSAVDPAASATTVAPTEVAASPASATQVTDNGFQVPAWLVVLVALLGAAGVVVLLVVERAPDIEVVE